MGERPQMVMKQMPTHCQRVEGGFIDASGKRWSKTPQGYRPNAEIMAEMQRDFD